MNCQFPQQRIIQLKMQETVPSLAGARAHARTPHTHKLTQHIPQNKVLLEMLTAPTIQEILRISWNLKFHYCVNNILPRVPIQSYLNPVHATPFYSLKAYFITIFSSMIRSSKWYIRVMFIHHK